MMNSNKSFLATGQAKIYLTSYLTIMTIIFLFPIIYSLIFKMDVTLLGMNVYFFELNLFASLVLFVYTYFQRDENKNWKLFLAYVILSLTYITFSMLMIKYGV